MIALDSSSLIAYLSGVSGNDVEAVEMSLSQKQAVLPPVVLTELLSDPKLNSSVIHLLEEFPLLELLDGFWERAGQLRSRLIRQGLKARLADTLVAQACIDHDVPLITRDRDFRHFEKIEKLKILG